MWPWNRLPSGYLTLAEEADGIDGIREPKEPFQKNEKFSISRLIYLATFALLCLAIGFTGGEVHQDNRLIAQFSQLRSSSKCTNPTTRREWRSLSTTEKESYIAAVRCLSTTPSMLREGGVLYDDFPYIHHYNGKNVHDAAAFLTWHRYFIHIYEMQLQNTCGYKGGLPYWDWSLDWEHLVQSPIFSNTTGFGGDGDINASVSVNHGHCVTTGRFSDIVPSFSSGIESPHCLSRGFIYGEVRGKLPGHELQPISIEWILDRPDYEQFFMALESGPHNQIPNSIRGDFHTFTAPNDPIFYLHHSQLDRLWWKWQQIDPWRRLKEYHGKALNGSEEMALITDIIHMGGLAEDVLVEDIMDTRQGLLCYRYL